MCLRSGLPLFAALALCLYAGAATSSNGYFLNGWGTESRSMAGAGVAMAEGAMVIATNPGGLALVRDDQFQIGTTFLHASPAYGASDFPGGTPSDDATFPINPGTRKGDPDVPLQVGGIFAIPHGAVTHRLDERSVVGLGWYGNGGLNATFEGFDNSVCPEDTPQSGVYCFGTAASDIAQVFLAPTYARELSPRVRVGVSLLLAWQTLEIRGLQAFAPQSSAPDKLTNKGHDDSFGAAAKIGLQVDVTPTLTLGVAGQTRGYMQRFEDYEGLLAGGGEFDIPPYLQAGLAWDLGDGWLVAMDVQKVWFGNIDSLANPPDAAAPLGASDGPGFGWDDVTRYKIGFRYKANETWTWRAGFADGDQPVPNDQLLFNLLAGSVIEKHYSAGFTYRFSPRNAVDIGVLYSPKNEIHGRNPGAPEQTLKTSLSAASLDLSWQHRF